MACCGGFVDQEHKHSKGVYEDRKCRDVLFLLLFLAFWAGMFIVCGLAFRDGDANRLVYATDSKGFLCGTVNVWRNTTINLTDYPNLYYLNALELLDPVNIPYAKSICVKECPGADVVCNSSSLPCTDSKQYMCPYYLFAEDSLYGYLAGVNNSDVLNYQYYLQLATANTAKCDTGFLSAAALKVTPSAFGFDSSTCDGASISGQYYQFTSQFPGQGPCYPVWVPTVLYFNRCFPKFPPEMSSAVVKAAVSTSSTMKDKFSSFSDDFNGSGQTLTNYIADISKGILIIVIGGLAGGLVLSLVSNLGGFQILPTAGHGP